MGALSAYGAFVRILLFQGCRGAAWWWGSLVGVLIGIAVIQVVFSILVAALAKKEPRDERDRLIEYKAFKVSYLTAICVGFYAMWMMFAGGQPSVGRGTVVTYALGILVGVEVVRTGTMLVLHRTGVSA